MDLRFLIPATLGLMIASTTSASLPLDSLTLMGVLDFDVPSGGSDGKAIHLMAVEAVSNLSEWGLGTANNGGGTDGEEYTFPAQSVAAGEHILLARSVPAMSAYLGSCIAEFDWVLEATSVINQNGNDAIELFRNGSVIETFGEADVDGTGTEWEYTDSWAFQESPGTWLVAPLSCSTGASTDQSACPYPLCDNSTGIPGCTDPSSCSFEPEATVDDLSCTYPDDPCDDGDLMTVFDAYNANCDCIGTPFVPSNSLVLTGVIHAGSAPKALEFYVLDDLETLMQYGLGTAQNGGGSDGVEWTFPDQSAEAGTFIYVANDADAFSSFFGFAPTFVDAGAVCNFNGNDAIELFEIGIGVDVFGEIDQDGSGSPWDYAGGWAYRVNGTGPDGVEFIQGNWLISSLDALTGPVANEFSDEPFPTGTYSPISNAVQDAPTAMSLQLFPNPTRNFLRIAASERLERLSVLDECGREVEALYQPGNAAVIDCSDWSPGHYLLLAMGEDGRVVRNHFVLIP